MTTSARLAAMLTMGAALAGCKTDGELVVDQGVGITAIRTACPAVGVPDYTGDITPSACRASTSADNIDVTAAITNLRSTCDDAVRASTPTPPSTCSPAAPIRAGARNVTLPYYSVVLRAGSSVVTKRVGQVTLSFADGQERAQARGAGRRLCRPRRSDAAGRHPRADHPQAQGGRRGRGDRSAVRSGGQGRGRARDLRAARRLPADRTAAGLQRHALSAPRLRFGADKLTRAAMSEAQTLHAAFAARIAAVLHALEMEGALPPGASAAPVTVEPPRDPSHGDLATNAAMVLAKQAATNPRALAEKIVEHLEARSGDRRGRDRRARLHQPAARRRRMAARAAHDRRARRRLRPLAMRARAAGQRRIRLGQPDRADAHGPLPRRGGGRRARQPARIRRPSGDPRILRQRRRRAGRRARPLGAPAVPRGAGRGHRRDARGALSGRLPRAGRAGAGGGIRRAFPRRARKRMVAAVPRSARSPR